MANKLPGNVSKEIKRLIFSKADAIGYGARSRVENGDFLNSLAQDETIGGVLRQYMHPDQVRTYIKDGVLNAYAKAKINEKLHSVSAESVVKSVFNAVATKVATIKETAILRDATSQIYLVTSGTFLKWETALRKTLECVESNSKVKDATTIHLCLVLVVSNGEMSFGDQKQIEGALGYIGVKVFFVR